MKQFKLAAKERTEKGKVAVNRLRKEGNIPAVIYGKSGSQALSVNEEELRNVLREAAGSASLLEVKIGDKDKRLAIFQQIELHPTRDSFLHIDFHELSAKEKMHTAIHVHIEGEAKGVKNQGGVIDVPLHSIDIECLPKDLPEYIEVDISDLEIGDSIHVKDLKKLEGVEYLADPEATVVHCMMPKKVEEPEPEAEEEGAEASKEEEKSEKE